MSDPRRAEGAGLILFLLAGERFGLPLAAVEGVAPPPVLARLPHAAPALLGAGHLGGRIMPVIDADRLLGRQRARPYDGSGEILRLRIGAGSAGFWVDAVERVIGAGSDRRGVRLLDPVSLLTAALAAPGLAAVPRFPLGEVGGRADEVFAAAPPPSCIVVEAAGRPVPLAQGTVLELIERLPWTPLPGAPAGFSGVGLLRGAAVPVLSLAALLGLGDAAAPGGFVAIAVGGRRALLAVERIVGLRADAGEPFEAAAAIPDELRRIVLGFPPADDEAPAAREAAGAAYLAFTVAGQDCAVPAAAVDRVIGPQGVVKLPRPVAGWGAAPLDGAIELRGQILPVAALRFRLGLADAPVEAADAPQAYVILRNGGRLAAFGVDRAKRLVRLRPQEIVPTPPGERSAVAGVAAWGEGGMLRLIAPERLWGPL